MILEFLEFQDRVSTVQVGRMVFQEFLEPRACLEMYSGQHLEIPEGTDHQDSLEIRVHLGHLELLDYLVGRTNSYNCSKV